MRCASDSNTKWRATFMRSVNQRFVARLVSVNALIGSGDDGFGTEEQCAFGRPIAAGASAVFCARNNHQRNRCGNQPDIPESEGGKRPVFGLTDGSWQKCNEFVPLDGQPTASITITSQLWPFVTFGLVFLALNHAAVALAMPSPRLDEFGEEPLARRVVAAGRRIAARLEGTGR